MAPTAARRFRNTRREKPTISMAMLIVPMASRFTRLFERRP
jgi:hypothetical protein